MQKTKAPNRSIAPKVQAVKSLELPGVDKTESKSGVPIYYLSGGPEQLVRVEIVFSAGLAKQKQRLEAYACNSLMVEGTPKYTGTEIASLFDGFGSYLQPKCNVDNSQITLYCLKKHLKPCLELLDHVLSHAAFPQNELEIFINNGLQKLAVQEEKTSYLCKRAFYKQVFGESNPIASFSLSNDYASISRETLIRFHHNYYKHGVECATICGDVGEEDVAILDGILCNYKTAEGGGSYAETSGPEQSQYIQKTGSAQATIRIGKRMFQRSHPDFRSVQLANMVLGGYFGSRLMKNLREEKGLTYGIYSTLETYKEDGCFYIEADVNAKNHSLAVNEIKQEIEQLNQGLVTEKELDKAKKYLIGSILRGIDGPFSIMDRWRILLDNDINSNYYSEYLDIINAATPENIRQTFNKYLNLTGTVEIVCGG